MGALQELTSATVVQAMPGNAAADMNGETIVLAAESGQYFGLEGIGADIWALIQQPIAMEAICKNILSEYDVAPDKCRADVDLFLRELLEIGIVETQEL